MPVTILVTGSSVMDRSSQLATAVCVVIGCNVRRLPAAERKLAYCQREQT